MYCCNEKKGLAICFQLLHVSKYVCYKILNMWNVKMTNTSIKINFSVIFDRSSHQGSVKEKWIAFMSNQEA